VTLVLDAGKGSAAVALAVALSRVWSMGHSLPPSQIAVRAALAGLVAILGHMFPVWLKFKGGKGVATSLGSFAMIAPKAILIALAAFIVVLVAFRYVSLSSVSAVAVFPLAVWLLGDYGGRPLVLGLVAASAVMIMIMHHENVRRLLSGTEPRMRWRRA
jgi:glycerol-3-phosphate acyltransferase PlsY